MGFLILTAESLIFFGLVWNWEPDPSSSILLIEIAPALFLLNIIMGLLFFLRKSKGLGSFFLLNAIVSPSIFYVVWTFWYEGWSDRNYVQYSFNIGTTKYEILLSRNSDDFSITDITNHQNGGNTMLYYERYLVKGDSIIIEMPERKMFIYNEKLYGFPHGSSSINLVLESDKGLEN